MPDRADFDVERARIVGRRRRGDPGVERGGDRDHLDALRHRVPVREPPHAFRCGVESRPDTRPPRVPLMGRAERDQLANGRRVCRAQVVSRGHSRDAVREHDQRRPPRFPDGALDACSEARARLCRAGAAGANARANRCVAAVGREARRPNGSCRRRAEAARRRASARPRESGGGTAREPRAAREEGRASSKATRREARRRKPDWGAAPTFAPRALRRARDQVSAQAASETAATASAKNETTAAGLAPATRADKRLLLREALPIIRAS